MDIRAPKWFGLLTISGSSFTLEARGSILQMQGEILKALQDLNPRQLAGGKNITIQYSDRPIAMNAKLSAIEELEAKLIQSDTSEGNGPKDGEDHASFRQRLIAEGHSTASATFFANDWFDIPQDSGLLAWMNDPKVQRFNELHATAESFASAMPSEYEMLKQYIQQTYPERAAFITFRTA